MKYLLVFASIFLVACATPVSNQYSILEKQKICCKSIRNINFSLIETNKFHKVILDNKNSQVFDFGQGKTYVSGIALPNIEYKYFHVRSYFNGSFIGQYAEPVILVLDNDYNTLEIIPVEVIFEDANWSTNAHMYGFFRPDKRAKYLVVHTRSSLDEDAPIANLGPSTSIFFAGDIPVVITNDGSSKKLERAPTGVIEIRLVPED